MSDNRQVAPTPRSGTSLVAKFAEKYSVDANKLLDTLKSTAFRQRGDQQVSNEQMMALLVVADQYGLNPFTKEIYAYNDKGAIVPVVSVDGWLRIINEHPQFDGMEFRYAEDWDKPDRGRDCYDWIECVIYRKDRNRPTVVREYLDETYQAPRGKDGGYDGPWQTHTKRMLRHKAVIQCGRVAFGFAGVHDDDEARHVVERDMGPVQFAEVPQPQAKSQRTHAAAARPALAADVADADGVIPDVVQRQREPVQQTAAPVQRQSRRATQAAPEATGREPGADDEQFEQDAAAGEPVSESVLRILKTKMEQAALGEADMRTRFGFGFEGVTKQNYQLLVSWIEDPVSA